MMRYIKLFEAFDDDMEEVVHVLKDICIELEDKEFDITISPGREGYTITTISISVVKISKNSSSVLFSYNEIEEVVDRIKEYLVGWYVDVITYGNDNLGMVDFVIINCFPD